MHHYVFFLRVHLLFIESLPVDGPIGSFRLKSGFALSLFSPGLATTWSVHSFLGTLRAVNLRLLRKRISPWPWARGIIPSFLCAYCFFVPVASSAGGVGVWAAFLGLTRHALSPANGAVFLLVILFPSKEVV